MFVRKVVFIVVRRVGCVRQIDVVVSPGSRSEENMVRANLIKFDEYASHIKTGATVTSYLFAGQDKEDEEIRRNEEENQFE